MSIHTLRSANKLRGRMNFEGGLAAEDAVARSYEARGATLLARRWRGRGGEVDLVLLLDGTLVVVEVKKATTCAVAAERLSLSQIGRVASAAEEYLATSGLGCLTPVRIDGALVDGTGRVEIIENISVA